MKGKAMNDTNTRSVLTMILLVFLIGLAPGSMGCGVFKDKMLQSKIREELGNNRNIPADKLTINAQRGIVTISGELYTREEIDLVVEIVSGIDGVVEVRNQMNLPDDFNSRNPTFLYPF